MKVTNSIYFNNYKIMPSLTWIPSMPWFLSYCHLADYVFSVFHIQFSRITNICEMFPLINTMSFHSCLILHIFFFLHSLYGSTGHQVRQETTKPTQKRWGATVYTRKRHAINSGCLCWLLGAAWKVRARGASQAAERSNGWWLDKERGSWCWTFFALPLTGTSAWRLQVSTRDNRKPDDSVISYSACS